jgi:hypothetical protein
MRFALGLLRMAPLLVISLILGFNAKAAEVEKTAASPRVHT